MEIEFRKSYNVYNSEPGWVIVYGNNDKGDFVIENYTFANEIRVALNFSDQRSINSFGVGD